MKHKKWISALAVLLSAVLIIGAFSGCKKNTDTSKKVTIQWWSPNWDEAVSKQLVSEFHAKNPNITVKLVVTDWDTYKSKITTAISANNAPQLSSVLITDVPQFAQKGLAQDLGSYCKEENIDTNDFLQNALNIAKVDGKIYGLPFRYDGSGIYYNVDMLKAAGYDAFPTTWSDLITMCKKLTNNGVYGLGWPLGNQGNAVNRFIQQLYTYGGSILNSDDKQCTLNGSTADKALTNIVDSIKEGYASPDSLEWDNTKLVDAFGTGKIAVYLDGPYDVATLSSSYPKLNFKTAVIPGVEGMGYTDANGWALMMAKNCEYKDQAAKFLAYVEEPANQARLTQTFPASKTAIKESKFSTEDLKPFADQLNNSKADPGYANWAEMEPLIYGYMQKAISGNISVDDALKGMTKDVGSVINE